MQFRMFAASNPFLCWDTRHQDLWLQYISHLIYNNPSDGLAHCAVLQLTSLTGILFMQTLQDSYLVDSGMILEDNPQEPVTFTENPLSDPGYAYCLDFNFHHLDLTSV